MKEKTKKITLTAIGIFFITFGIFAMDFSIYRSNWGWVLWLCYWGMIIIGFGILTKNSYLILSQLNMLAIPLIFWNIDFFYFLIKKKVFGESATIFFRK